MQEQYSITLHQLISPTLHLYRITLHPLISPGLLLSRPYQLLNVLNRLTFPLYAPTHCPNTARLRPIIPRTPHTAWYRGHTGLSRDRIGPIPGKACQYSLRCCQNVSTSPVYVPVPFKFHIESRGVLTGHPHSVILYSRQIKEEHIAYD